MSVALSRKMILPLIAVLILSLFVSACGGRSQATLVSGKINIVASFYPLYDFARNIGGEHVNVINLVPAGVEPHDWSPKSRDMKNLTRAELFVYLGAGFEGWVEDTLKSMPKDSKTVVVEASKGIGLLPATEQHDHDHEEKGKKDSHESEYDPHVWLSPVNAKQIALNIKEALIKADSAHQADFEANYKKYAEQLDQLDNKYKTELAKTPKKEIVVTHQSFGYLAKQYGLTQKPIMGLSPDAEPTSKDMKDILQFIKSNQIKYVFFEELVSDKLAKTLAKDAGVETLVLSPVEGLTEEQAKLGANYISVMDNNLNNLIKALQ
ncbi:metal ABC transporter substrate-binding protein [Paenibacillus allorhizosphaerae]|uniref:High-affinity zinc uptake system binding-protein ZnuA n=1 Tax=Paenibacillus allorhizosphaerae TaxID=2849866 RepID=A0ABN7TK46_9BACL|nr:metal ABC transporter substrate-binding protein [Paenibacillus allorhizosphaerae]CAG7642500.1 High-affinity zinc uptake system binding-protein ZnuA [Paenibacillus allorhizosphaerae]